MNNISPPSSSLSSYSKTLVFEQFLVEIYHILAIIIILAFQVKLYLPAFASIDNLPIHALPKNNESKLILI